MAGLQGCRRAEQRLEWWQCRGQRPRGRLCGQRGAEAETLVLDLPPENKPEETHEMAAREHELQTSVDSLRREVALMREEAARQHEVQTSVDSLRTEMALMQEDTAQERGQQGATGDKTAVLPGVLKEEEAIKEKDALLREAQAEVAREHQLRSIELKAPTQQLRARISQAKSISRKAQHSESELAIREQCLGTIVLAGLMSCQSCHLLSRPMKMHNDSQAWQLMQSVTQRQLRGTLQFTS
ncbi:uncharacterized protein [Manis javanica]|uniref:uncharacterized protein n=1 Tax=Manis javanica TaxID=9974 RepID=UPI003C6D28C4